MASSRRVRHLWLCPPRTLAVVLGALAPFALASLVPLLESCDGSDGTGGTRVVLHTRVELASEELTTFDNELDWHVTLERAWLSTGPFGYFDGAPALTALRPASVPPARQQLLERFLGVSVAYAHPGHYHSGEALGEMLEPASVELLSGPSTLGDGDGVSGIYRSARFTFSSPPTGPYVRELDGHVAVVEGRAELDGEEPRYFRAVADLEELAEVQAGGHVDGCPFREADVQGDGTVTVHIDPSVWFDLVDFGALEPGLEGEPTEFQPGSQPRLAFAQGLAQLSAYEFSYSR